MADRQLVGVIDTRVHEGALEGLLAYDDGSREWKRPASVEVEVVNDRTGEHAEVRDLKLEGAPCE